MLGILLALSLFILFAKMLVMSSLFILIAKMLNLLLAISFVILLIETMAMLLAISLHQGFYCMEGLPAQNQFLCSAHPCSYNPM